jgi:hypothetical protein
MDPNEGCWKSDFRIPDDSELKDISQFILCTWVQRQAWWKGWKSHSNAPPQSQFEARRARTGLVIVDCLVRSFAEAVYLIESAKADSFASLMRYRTLTGSQPIEAVYIDEDWVAVNCLVRSFNGGGPPQDWVAVRCLVRSSSNGRIAEGSERAHNLLEIRF